MINTELHEYEVKAVNTGKKETNLRFADDKILYVEFSKEKLSKTFSRPVNVHKHPELSLYFRIYRACHFLFLAFTAIINWKLWRKKIITQNNKKIVLLGTSLLPNLRRIYE